MFIETSEIKFAIVQQIRRLVAYPVVVVTVVDTQEHTTEIINA